MVEQLVFSGFVVAHDLTDVWAGRHRFVASEAVVAADIGDGLVLLNVDTGVYYGLNVVGASSWRLLAEGKSAEAVLASLLREYDVDEDRLRTDLDRLFADLVRCGLVRLLDDDAS